MENRKYIRDEVPRIFEDREALEKLCGCNRQKISKDYELCPDCYHALMMRRI